MGTIAASEIIARASEIAEDEDNVTWLSADALEWVNDAQRAICLLRPDAKTLNHSVQLVPGTKQAITGRRLIKVTRNMGADGSTPGKVINIIDQNTKDDSDPDWHSETAATAITEYIYDVREPKVFYVSPPVHASTAVYVEVSEVVNPTALTDVADLIDIEDVYVTPMIEWVCYRFFGRDSEMTPNYARAAGFYKSFFNLLGEKLRVDIAIRPEINKEL